MKYVKLGDVASYINGYAFKPSDYSSEGKPIIRIQNLTGNAYQTNLYNGEIPQKYLITKGDVLISWSASLGVYEWTGEEAYLNQHIFKVCFDKQPVNKNFFVHQTAYAIKKASSQAHGSTMTHLTKKVFESISFAYPSLDKQMSIGAVLDKVKAQLILNKKYLLYCDELVKSRFMEMFGDPVEGCDWNRMRLDDLCSKLGSGATPRGGKSAYKNEGVPLIRSMNVYNGYFSWKELAYIDDNQAKKLNGVTLRKGDVLLNITGASVARSCVLPSELAGGRVNQHVAIIRADQEKILPVFLNAIFVSESYQHFLLNGSKMAGATREAITKQDLKEMTVPIPPLELQKKFAAFSRQVDKLKFDFDFLVSFKIPSICLLCLELDP